MAKRRDSTAFPELEDDTDLVASKMEMQYGKATAVCGSLDDMLEAMNYLYANNRYWREKYVNANREHFEKKLKMMTGSCMNKAFEAWKEETLGDAVTGKLKKLERYMKASEMEFVKKVNQNNEDFERRLIDMEEVHLAKLSDLATQILDRNEQISKLQEDVEALKKYNEKTLRLTQDIQNSIQAWAEPHPAEPASYTKARQIYQSTYHMTSHKIDRMQLLGITAPDAYMTNEIHNILQSVDPRYTAPPELPVKDVTRSKNTFN